MQPIFITGIGTGVGKTLVSAIVTRALGGHYWKPVQAGFEEGTDAEWVSERIGGQRIFPDLYRLKLAASPHIAAREEGVEISLDRIAAALPEIRPLVVEGAGGLLVPLNDRQFVLDLIQRLDASVILVSRNYLGSINHSLLTAEVCRMRGLRVAGWIFNDQYLHYEQEIVRWSGIPHLGSIPFGKVPSVEFVAGQAEKIGPALREALGIRPD
ncbi:MAG: dethiobiotin synthase [Bacteroidetes bacterium]|nr:dethiobiotin synthase [Bacteroidota bacterium]